MNKNILLISTILLIIFASCSKQQNDSGDQVNQKEDSSSKEVNCKVSSMISGNGVKIAFNYTYDEKGRIKFRTSGVGKDQDSTIFTYSDQKIIEQRRPNKYTYYVSSITYLLDNAGKVISMTSANGNLVCKFIYDDNGYLVRADRTELIPPKGSQYRLSVEYLYTAGNLTSLKTTTVENNVPVKHQNIKLNYDQETFRPNFVNFYRVPYMFVSPEIMGYMGTKSKNRISSVNDDINGTASYKYTEDNKGNITNVKLSSTSLFAQSEEADFVYNCK